MVAVFGPAPGPRRKADGTPSKPEEAGITNGRWMTVSYRTDRETQPARTEARNLSTSCLSRLPSPESDFADDRT